MAGPIAFGRYVLLDQLATGGMAEIFLARDTAATGQHRTCVIKRVLPSLASNPDFLEMFLDEAKIAARLHHPGIVQILDLGRQGDDYFLAMEYLAGEDAGALLSLSKQKHQPIAVAAALEIAARAADALHHAHNLRDDAGRPLNIVHRDVSPSNIFITYAGDVKLLDFGIARAEERLFETRVGQIKGKAGYMSPEQARGDPVDARADVWSLGVCLHELLAGRALFSRDTWPETIYALREGPIPRVSELRPDVPETVDALLSRALERRLEDRLPSAEAFAEGARRLSSGFAEVELGALLMSAFGAQRAEARIQVSGLFDALPERVDTENILFSADFGLTKSPGPDEPETPVKTDPHRVTQVIPEDQPARPAIDGGLDEPTDSLLSVDDAENTDSSDEFRPDTEPNAASLHLRPNSPHTELRGLTAPGTTRRWMWVGTIAGLASAAAVAWGLGLLRPSPHPSPPLVAEVVRAVPVPPPPEPQAPPPTPPPPPPAAEADEKPVRLEPEPEPKPKVEPEKPAPREVKAAESSAPDPKPDPLPEVAVAIPPDFHPGERPHHPKAAPSPALLTVDANEPMNVSFDGGPIGTVPLKRYRVPAGEHRVKLENHLLGLSRVIHVSLRAGEEQTQFVTFLKGRLNVSSQPWADVFVDGRKVGTTPLAAREVWEGRHVIRLVGPQSEKTVTVDVVAGQTVVVKERLP